MRPRPAEKRLAHAYSDVTSTASKMAASLQPASRKPDVAVVDALLTVRNVNGLDGTIIPVIPINFFYVAVCHADHWQIEDGRAFRARAA